MQNCLIQISANFVRTSALVDTGCTLSSCSLAFAKRVRSPILPLSPTDSSFLITANSQPIKVVGRINLTINVRGLLMPFSFLVLDHLSHNILLGFDFLKDHSAYVDFGSNTITFGDNLVSLRVARQNSPEAILTSAENVIIPPRTEALVRVTIPPSFIGSVCMIGPMGDAQKLKFPVARVVYRPTNHIGCCRVFNPSKDSKLLRQNSRIASISPVEVLTKTQTPISGNKNSINALRSPPSLAEMEKKNY